jgi:uncharacterized protein YciI
MFMSKHYMLFYDTAPDYLERRGEFRSVHLNMAWDAHARGELVLAGAVSDPTDGAMLLFKGDTPEAAERFAQEDPYVKHGLILRWRVREWLTVAGDAPANPVRP